jgi:biopolymer transport protein TolR
MSRDKFKKGHYKPANINLTPFVDILFVLLIVFMIATPIILGGVKIELPQGKTEAITVDKEPISISIKKDGTIYIGEDRIKLRLLPQKLKRITNGDKNTTIFIRADQNLDYGRVIKVVSKINLAGFTKVSLVTDLKGEI